jgi:hypothetical protein
VVVQRLVGDPVKAGAGIGRFQAHDGAELGRAGGDLAIQALGRPERTDSLNLLPRETS